MTSSARVSAEPVEQQYDAVTCRGVLNDWITDRLLVVASASTS
jgi:hypothetical protein